LLLLAVPVVEVELLLLLLDAVVPGTEACEEGASNWGGTAEATCGTPRPPFWLGLLMMVSKVDLMSWVTSKGVVVVRLISFKLSSRIVARSG
jgi:hypothetical protein